MWILFLYSCGKVEETTVVSSSGSSSQTSYKWATSSLPLTFAYSDSFSSNEVTAIQTADQDWSDAVSNQLDFFDTTTSTSNVEYSNTDSYRDSVLGFYKYDNSWPSDFPTTALAVTQLYGIRVSASVVQLTHADILYNNYYFSFSTDNTPGTYDFRTVTVHEMGHAIGVQHTSDSSIDSVMQPSVSTATTWTTPYAYDQQVVCSLYGLSNCSTSLLANQINGGGIQSTAAASADEPVGEIGDTVRLQMELSADGKCKHYMDGKLIHEHDAHVAKNKVSTAE
jgi:hypothetical protein